MKIKQSVLEQINNPVDRTKIASALAQGEQSIASACRLNTDNSALTKYAALIVISKVTGTPIPALLEGTNSSEENDLKELVEAGATEVMNEQK